MQNLFYISEKINSPIIMKKLSFLIFTIALVFSSCNEEKDLTKVMFTGQAQGTYYAVTYYNEDGRSYQHEIDSILALYDKSVSVYLDNSIITRVNNNDSLVETDSYFNENFVKSMEVSEKSNGAFDVTVGPLINAWGFGLEKQEKIDSLLIDSILSFVGYRKVELHDNKVIKQDPRMVINYNAIAQGYSVDILGKYLEQEGISNYLIDIGGEVIGKGTKENEKPWIVGIQVPTESKDGKIEAETLVSLKDKALATSGSYRKYYEKDGMRYSHTIDPATGYPVKHSLLSVSVMAKDGITADAWATAFMVMGVEKAVKYLETQEDLDAHFIFSSTEGELQTYTTKGIEELLVTE